MQNIEGQTVDLYIPRKCDAVGKLLKPDDHASIQVTIANVNELGGMTAERKRFDFCGFIRTKGEADEALYRIAKENGLLDDIL